MLVDSFKLKGQGDATAKNVAAAVVNEIINERSLKGIDLQKNWDMLEGHHAKYFKSRYNEAADVFAYRKENAVVSNLVGFSINLSARYLYGRNSKVIRKYSEDEKTQARMQSLAKQIELDTFLLDAAKKAPTFGKVTARLVAVDAETGLQPEGKATETTYPHPILLDPLNTFVKRNKWGKIIAVVMKYKANDWGKSKCYTVTELIVDDSRWVWVDEGGLSDALGALAVSASVVNLDSGTKVQATDNKYRLSDEFIDLLNNQDERSDIEDIMDLNIAFDEALTDKRHFFNKHGWPQLVSEVNLENVQNSPNKVWEITPDVDDGKKVLDRLGFLTWDGKMSDYKEFIENLERLIYIQSNTAAISTGDLKAIGQLRSGAALITAHSVAIHKTEEKQLVWERNEKALFKALINFDSLLHNEKVESRYRDFNPVIRFPRDFVPGAEQERAQIQKLQADSHLRPLRDIIQENDPECVDNKVLEKKYQEIMDDSKNISDSTRKFETESAPAGASGKSGTSMQKSKEQK
jgi:hypothetical protein